MGKKAERTCACTEHVLQLHSYVLRTYVLCVRVLLRVRVLRA